MNDDLLELMRIRQLIRQLELPAYLFERYGGDCRGDCAEPRYLCETYPEALMCCHLKPIADFYHVQRLLEQSLRRKVEALRNVEAA